MKKYTNNEIVQAFINFKEAETKLKEVKEYLANTDELPIEVVKSERVSRSYSSNGKSYIIQMLSKEYDHQDFMELLSPAKMEKAVDKESYDKTAKHIIEKVSFMYKLKI